VSPVLVFEFPLPENLGNARLHWAAKNRRKLDYYDLLDTLVTVKQNPRPPSQPWLKAVATMQMRTWRAMDEGNARSRTKWIDDWLETRGYIQNDRYLTYDKLEPVTAGKADLGITLILREAA
jgi:hypothetical protein